MFEKVKPVLNETSTDFNPLIEHPMDDFDRRVGVFFSTLHSSPVLDWDPDSNPQYNGDTSLYLKTMSNTIGLAELAVFISINEKLRLAEWYMTTVDILNEVFRDEKEKQLFLSILVKLSEADPIKSMHSIASLSTTFSAFTSEFQNNAAGSPMHELASKIPNYFLAEFCSSLELVGDFDFRDNYYDRDRYNAYVVKTEDGDRVLNRNIEGGGMPLPAFVLNKLSDKYSVIYGPHQTVYGFFKNIEDTESSLEHKSEKFHFPEQFIDDLYAIRRQVKGLKTKIMIGDDTSDSLDLLVSRFHRISQFLPEEVAKEAGSFFTQFKSTANLNDNKIIQEIDSVISSFSRYISGLESNKKIVLLRQIEDVFKAEGFSDFEDSVIEVYITLLQPQFRIQIESEFKIRLESLPMRVQLQFLKLIFNGDKEYIAKVVDFIDRAGDDESARLDRFKSFLSLERGDETLGDSIVAFGQYDEVAGTVFRYYSELLSSADRAEELVREVSACEGEACVEFANQVRENILNRAQKDLENAVRAHNPSEVASQIENYVAAAKEYVALLQEVGAGNIESVSPEMLSEGDRTRMQNLLQANYRKSYPDLNDTKFRDAVAGSLTKSFKNPNTTFRILRDQDKIVSYNRFDTLRDYTGKEVSYFGSFNADPAYSGVGGVMLEETIKDRLEDGRPMMAYSDPGQPITKKYIEDGFVVTELHPFGGKNLFEIWRSKDSVDYFESKAKSITELLSFIGSAAAVVVREQSDVETYPELQSGMALTRYFNHQGKTFVVFEKLPDTLRDWFTPPQEEFKKAA